MRLTLFLFFAISLYLSSPSHAGFFDDLSREVLSSSQKQSSLDNNTIVKGLKEALATGTERAVSEVAKPDGYFSNQLIKIFLPDKIQQAANLLKQFGYQKQVDELELSMNRAAEKAAPKAAAFFGDAIRQMTVDDARGILSGGDMAATKFFENKTRVNLFNAFKPNVSKSMDQVGTAQVYKEMIGKYEAVVPLATLVGTPNIDMDTYVTNQALDGLFKMVGEEEKKIRTNPAAQTTDLLRKVFGGK